MIPSRQVNLSCVAAIAGLMVHGWDAANARECVQDDFARARGFSQAVVTSGGRTVWIAGTVAIQDSDGQSIAGDFDAQVREVFRQIETAIKKAGGRGRGDLVMTTVVLRDISNRPRFLEVRRELFADCAPAAELTIGGLPVPDAQIGISGIAVIEGASR